MKRYEDLSGNERERAIETCRSRIRSYMAQETIAINTELRRRGPRAWWSELAIYQMARGEVDELAEEMARAAFYPERGDMFVMIQMEVM